MSMDYNFVSAINPRGVERNGSISGLEQNPYAVLAVAGARVYHTKLNSKEKDKDSNSQWIYSRWKGTLTFGRDIETPNTAALDITETERHWFRLADDETGRTVWMFKFPENFQYSVDRPFFHVFQGRTRRYGFLFNDDDEASVFGQKVMDRLYTGHPPTSKKSRNSKSTNSGTTTTRSKSLTSTPISRTMISSPAPQSFKHIAHVGVSKDGVFEATKNLDEEWKVILADLQGHAGVSEAPSYASVGGKHHSNFADGFWKGVEAIRMVEDSELSVERFDLKDISRKMTSASAM